jgi:hypothetical protein
MISLSGAMQTYLSSGTALIAKLGGTAIYNTLAPQGVGFPRVVHFQGAETEDNTSPRRAQTYLWTIKAEAKTQKEAEEIDDLIDALVHDGTLSITGWNDYWMRRESGISYVEGVSGKELVWHDGAQYRIRMAE